MPPTQVPTNGLVLYTGTIMTDDGKEKKVQASHAAAAAQPAPGVGA